MTLMWWSWARALEDANTRAAQTGVRHVVRRGLLLWFSFPVNEPGRAR